MRFFQSTDRYNANELTSANELDRIIMFPVQRWSNKTAISSTCVQHCLLDVSHHHHSSTIIFLIHSVWAYSYSVAYLFFLLCTISCLYGVSKADKSLPLSESALPTPTWVGVRGRHFVRLFVCSITQQEGYGYRQLNVRQLGSLRPWDQGRPVNVKHDARCVMGKVGGRQKNPNRGKFNLLL